MTRIHHLKERVTCLKRQIVTQENGLMTESWEEGKTIWARVQPLKPGELAPGEGWDDPKQRRGAVYSVTIRSQKGLKLDRLRWRGSSYAIVAMPVIDEARVWMSFLITLYKQEIEENRENDNDQWN